MMLDHIDAFIFDFDGVLTNDKVYVGDELLNNINLENYN